MPKAEPVLISYYRNHVARLPRGADLIICGTSENPDASIWQKEIRVADAEVKVRRTPEGWYVDDHVQKGPFPTRAQAVSLARALVDAYRVTGQKARLSLEE